MTSNELAPAWRRAATSPRSRRAARSSAYGRDPVAVGTGARGTSGVRLRLDVAPSGERAHARRVRRRHALPCWRPRPAAVAGTRRGRHHDGITRVAANANAVAPWPFRSRGAARVGASAACVSLLGLGARRRVAAKRRCSWRRPAARVLLAPFEEIRGGRGWSPRPRFSRGRLRAAAAVGRAGDTHAGGAADRDKCGSGCSEPSDFNRAVERNALRGGARARLKRGTSRAREVEDEATGGWRRRGGRRARWRPPRRRRAARAPACAVARRPTGTGDPIRRRRRRPRRRGRRGRRGRWRLAPTSGRRKDGPSSSARSAPSTADACDQASRPSSAGAPQGP